MLDRAKQEASPSLDLFLAVGVDGIDYEGKRLLCQAVSTDPHGYVFGDTDTETVRVLSTETIWSENTRGRLSFFVPSENGLPEKVRLSLRKTLGAFNDRERDNIVMRMRFVLAVDTLDPTLPKSFVDEGVDHGRTAIEPAPSRLSRSAAAWQPICDHVADEHKSDRRHWQSVYRWWLLWRKSGRDPRAPAGLDRHKGRRERRMTEQQLIGLGQVACYLSPSQPNFASVKGQVNATILRNYLIENPGADRFAAPLVSYDVVRRECMRISREVVLHHRLGKSAARDQIAPSYSGEEATLPFQRVEADFKYLGLVLTDESTGFVLGNPVPHGGHRPILRRSRRLRHLFRSSWPGVGITLPAPHHRTKDFQCGHEG